MPQQAVPVQVVEELVLLDLGGPACGRNKQTQVNVDGEAEGGAPSLPLGTAGRPETMTINYAAPFPARDLCGGGRAAAPRERRPGGTR